MTLETKETIALLMKGSPSGLKPVGITWRANGANIARYIVEVGSQSH